MAQLTPLWLGDLLAAVVIATAVYCGGRIVYAKVRNRATHDDVDGLHLLMGVAMAGMLTAHLADLTPVRGMVHAAWVTVFALCTVWFGYRALRQRGQTSADGSGALVHLVGSAAMLYMLAVATSGGAMAGAAMSGASGGAARLPELGILLAVLATGAAVLIVDRSTVTVTASTAAPVAVARRILAPRAAEGCHLAMCVIMAYMLIAMFA